jgi:predicted hotdog family 3-hydroxylacyl-ACP dehydratase
MVLIDRILEVEPGRVACAVDLRSDSAFCRDGRVPSYVGVEYMAQTVGALVGWECLNNGLPVRTGFLVSVRKYTSLVDGFVAGTTLVVEARHNWRDDEGVAVMDCRIFYPAGTPVAESRLTVFQPANLDAYLATP